MNKISSLFKVITGVIYAVPGIPLFMKDIYPLNISKGLLTTICEVLAGIIILLTANRKGQIKAMSDNRKTRIAAIFSGFGIFILLSFGFFVQKYVVVARDKSSILLAVGGCSDDFKKVANIAAADNENIAEHIGKEHLLRILDNDCPLELFYSKIIFNALVVILFNIIIFIFIFLALGATDRPIRPIPFQTTPPRTHSKSP
jgi:hypothetical protein